MNSKEAQLISLGLEVQSYKNKPQNDLILNKLRVLEEKYYQIWFEINKEKLEDKFIEVMREKGYEDDTIQLMLCNKKFDDFCRDKCILD